MVVKTDLCNYSEYKIYPGRGMKFIAKDARTTFFLNAKVASLFHQKIKAVKLTWTQVWRRMNKKGKIEAASKRKKGRALKFQKAIVGMSLEDLKRKKAAKTDLRKKAVEEAKSEAKARVAKKGNSKPQMTQGKKAPMKNQQKNQGGGSKKNFKGKM